MSSDSADHLTVAKAVTDDNSIINMSRVTMNKINAQSGDYIFLSKNDHLGTLAVVIPDDSVDDNFISCNKYIRVNLRVTIGDSVRAKVCTDLRYASKLVVLPIKDTVLNVSGNLLEVFLKPYFMDAFRPVTVGDVFGVTGALTHVDFKVISLQPSPSSIITNGTLISWEGTPIHRQVEDRYVAEVTFEDIGGRSTSLAKVWALTELPLRHPEIFITTGIAAPCVALCGPEGCGKKLLSVAIANEASSKFILINCRVMSSGSTSQCKATFRKAFNKAEKAKGLLFVDSFDSLYLVQNQMFGKNQYPLLEIFCCIFEEFMPCCFVLVISSCDEDVVKPILKWCEMKIILQHPNVIERQEVLGILTRNLNLSPDVDFKKISEATQGYVGRDLKTLVSMAVCHQLQLKFPSSNSLDGSMEVDALSGFRVDMASFQASLDMIRQTRYTDATYSIPTIKFDDVGGYAELKSYLLDIVQAPLVHLDKFIALGIEPSYGCLLYGPPGCGKTRLVQAVANECNTRFISVNGPEVISNEVGKSEELVRKIFEQAQSLSPCILFLDEFESLAKSRSTNPGDVIERIVTQLLVELDGVKKGKNVFVIAATNRPDSIDSALLRPGRLSELVYVTLPDEVSRDQIFTAILRHTQIEEGVATSWLANETDGFSSADLKWLCQTAGKLAIKESIEAEKQRQTTKDAETSGELQIKKEHFEAVLKVSKPSVSSADLEVYELFSRSHRRNAG